MIYMRYFHVGLFDKIYSHTNNLTGKWGWKMAITLNKSANAASSISEQSSMPINPPDVGAMIAERAYHKAEKRGFARPRAG